MVVTLAIYLSFALTIDSETSGKRAQDAYYNRLVDGLLAGHVWMDKPVPDALKALPDPYDRDANGVARGMTYTPSFIHDLSYYRGRLYMYFSVVPAVIVFLPFRVLTGHYLSHQLASAIFVGLAFLTGTALICSIWRRCFAAISANVAALGVLALGLASTAPIMMERPDVYEVPIGGSYLFAMLAVACLWRMTDETVPLARWAAWLSVAVGGWIGCRPSEFPVTGVLLVPLILAWQRSRPPARLLARGMPVLIATVLPVLVIGLGVLGFNYARFGDPMEFGFKYHLSGDPPGLTMFSVRNLGYNLWMYFVNFPGVSAHFPFAGPWRSALLKPATVASVEHPLGLLTTVPFVLCSIAIPFNWSRLTARVRMVALALVWIAASNALLMCFFFGSIARYQMAFAPELVLLAIIGLLGLEAGMANYSRRAIAVVRTIWIGALLYSVAYNVLIAIRVRGSEHSVQGTALLVGAHDVNGALAEYRRALELDPDLTAVRSIVGSLDLQLGRTDDAIFQYRRILDTDPDNGDALNSLGGLLALKGEASRAEALQYVTKALAKEPNLAEAHANLAAILATEPSQRERAIAECRIALRLKPELPQPQNLLRLLGVNGNLEIEAAMAKAREKLAQAASTDEKLAVHREIAELAFRHGDYAAATAEYEEMCRLKPNDAQLENNLGAYLSRDPRRTDEAIEHFRAAIRLAPQFAEPHNNLGVVFAQKPGYRDQAAAEYRKALAIRPDYEEARKNLAELVDAEKPPAQK